MTLLEELEAALAVVRQKHTTPTGTPSTPYYTGPGGLFGVAGLERELISTRVQPIGLAGSLPARGSLTTYPYFPYLTGFQAATGDNPDGVCDDGPIAGPGKACIQTAQFGRYTCMTRELEVNRIGQQINRGEFQDMELINPPMLTSEGIVPNVPGNPAYVREVLMRFMEVGIWFQDTLGKQLWIGNPANNSINGGYEEFPGADILIGTTKIDAKTGNACPSLASDVKDFNYLSIDDNGDALVNALVYLLRYLKWNAERMRLNPATWSLAMTPSCFYEVTAVWPCSYLTYRCNFRTADGTMHVNVDAKDQIAMRDNMRKGRYLTVDGEDWPVVLDDAIPEDSSTTNSRVPEGSFSSDIYVINRTILGTRATTFWEFFDYAKTMTAIADGHAQEDYWSDSGRFLWHKKPQVNWCNQWIAKVEPRLIIQCPQLCGRLNNVMYKPLQHVRQPFQDDPYFVDGGVTTGYTTTQPYSEWNLKQS